MYESTYEYLTRGSREQNFRKSTVKKEKTTTDFPDNYVDLDSKKS